MGRKSNEKIAFDALSKLIDLQLKRCTEPDKDEWVNGHRENFFKFDDAGHVTDIYIEGSQFVVPEDKWFRYIADFKKLEGIVFDWCGDRITGRGFRHITGLKRLKGLCVWTCKVKDSSMLHLAQIKSLEWLRLCETEITDKGLKAISQLPKLRGLEFFSTKITDKGLAHLRVCRKLEHLDLTVTEVTREGVTDLAKYLPKCHIQTTLDD